MRHVLPISSKTPIAPHVRTAIVGIPSRAMQPQRIFIGGPDPDRWIVHGLSIDGRPQLSCVHLPGSLFSSRGVVAVRRGTSAFTLMGLDVATSDKPVELIVSYVGPNPEGERLVAAIIGEDPLPASPRLEITSDRPLRSVTIAARLHCAFRVDRLEIEGEAGDWEIDDIRINSRSQFAQPGALPGTVFHVDAIDNFVQMDTCRTGNTIELDARFIGTDPAGAVFRASYEGTIVVLDGEDPSPLWRDPPLLAEVTTVERTESRHDGDP